MDWPRAIDRNRKALMRIVAGLFALAGLPAPACGRFEPQVRSEEFSLPRHLYAAILLILRPAESAVRRLIVILAASSGKLGSTCKAPRAADAAMLQRLHQLGATSLASHTPAFALFDPLKSFDPDEIWNADPARQIRFQSGFDPDPDPFSGFRTLADSREPVPASNILKRLSAIRLALNNLPGQARRFARCQARRDLRLKAGRPARVTSFRPGLPPGWRQRRIHEIDDVLRECHGLALDAVNGPDTG